MKNLNREDRLILAYLEDGLEISKRPFKKIAEDLCLSEEIVLEKIAHLMDTGYILNFQAKINYPLLGFKENLLVVWKIPQEKVFEIAKIIVDFKEISHCYLRSGWNYNLFTMIHAKDRKRCLRVVEEIKKKTEIADYELLFTKEEYKKNYMRYFNEERKIR